MVIGYIISQNRFEIVISKINWNNINIIYVKEYKKISMANIQLFFMIFVFGTILSILLLLIELAFSKFYFNNLEQTVTKISN